MNIRSFVGASSALLVAWLGATYLHEIPPDRYPKQGRTSALSHNASADETVADLGSTER